MTDPIELPATPPPAPEQADPWAEIGWAYIARQADQNLDLLPARFQLDGCPECGAVWTSLLAVGYTPPHISGGTAHWDGRAMHIVLRPPPLDLRAARVSCFSGHTFEFDSYTGSHRTYRPNWASAAILGGMAMLASSGYMLHSLLGKHR